MSPRARDPLTVEHALLGLLHHHPAHGYEVYQRLTKPGGLRLVWRLKRSQLYALLAKLSAAGYVEVAMQPQAGRPPRKVYRLTPQGQEAFFAWLQEPVPRGRHLRVDFLVKLYVARQEGSAAVARLLAAQRAACWRWLGQEAAKADPEDSEQTYEWLVHRFRAGQLQAMIDWLVLCEKMLLPSQA